MSFVLLFFVLVYVTNIGYLVSDTTTDQNVTGEEDSREVKMDPLADHTFVALLDIVFTDGTKRTCTGTIIHESVVLTAAHCFTNPDNEKATPELLASFVVVGTKKMFSTGYEHYLPIEKILIHPKYHGWTADLALVYTFASMTGHKPGSILPLAGERTSTYVDANVTVLSWGPSVIIEEGYKEKYEAKGESDCDGEEEGMCSLRMGPPGLQTVLPHNIEIEKDSDESETVFKSRIDTNPIYQALRSNPTSMREEKAKQFLGKDDQRVNSLATEYDLGEKLQSNEDIIIDNDFVTEPAFLAEQRASSNQITQSKTKTPSKNILPESAYSNMRKFDQIDDEEMEAPYYANRKARLKEWPDSIYVNSRRFAETIKEQIPQNRNYRRFDQSLKGSSIYRRQLEESSQPPIDSVDIKSHYRNWRRLMGTQQNHLKVDIYGFVNQKVCESMVETELPPAYHLGTKNDVVCFSGDDQFITDDDSGAPVVKRGKLIAVAIGGVKNDNAHVAIGMKMSCYCSWIADNLPEPRPNIVCCYNCCEVTHLKDGVSRPPDRYYEPKAKIISF